MSSYKISFIGGILFLLRGIIELSSSSSVEEFILIAIAFLLLAITDKYIFEK